MLCATALILSLFHHSKHVSATLITGSTISNKQASIANKDARMLILSPSSIAGVDTNGPVLLACRLLRAVRLHIAEPNVSAVSGQILYIYIQNLPGD